MLFFVFEYCDLGAFMYVEYFENTVTYCFFIRRLLLTQSVNQFIITSYDK